MNIQSNKNKIKNSENKKIAKRQSEWNKNIMGVEGLKVYMVSSWHTPYRHVVMKPGGLPWGVRSIAVVLLLRRPPGRGRPAWCELAAASGEDLPPVILIEKQVHGGRDGPSDIVGPDYRSF